MNFELYTEKEFLSAQDLIDNPTKTRGLNSLKFRVDQLAISTEDARVLSKIASICMLLEDAYKISMYKFQFKTFIFSLTKEIKNLEEYIKNIE